ncbi:plasmid mobilization protein [Mycobacteroides abscessus]|uniref:plasmid mobilization protein n=1 Tax=Mycobacteroides abscessus TaxID=36809 RepID=UPI000C25B7B7|nr:hypothetical protein [Mycobacteroides abscessus]
MSKRAGGAKKRRTSRITFMLTDEEKAWLLAEARKEGLSLSGYLRRELLISYRLDQLRKEATRRAEEARRAAEEARARWGQYGSRGARSAHRGRFASAADAEAWLQAFVHAVPGESVQVMLRRACHKAHPDKGGRAEDWVCVDEIRRMLLVNR